MRLFYTIIETVLLLYLMLIGRQGGIFLPLLLVNGVLILVVSLIFQKRWKLRFIPYLFSLLSALAVTGFGLLPLYFLHLVEYYLKGDDKIRKRVFISFVLFSLSKGFLLILSGDFSSLPFFGATVIFIPFFLKSLTKEIKQRESQYKYLKTLVENKNKLLSTLTHELRTPLTVIGTSTEMILEERAGPLNKAMRSLLTSAHENVGRLSSLVENILSQVKAEFAWFSMEKRVYHLPPLIRKIALDMTPFLESRGQSLEYNYPALIGKIVGDKRWIEQVIINLVHNGSKNSPKGSVILISLKENEKYQIISVHDRGMGIGDKEIEKVFDPFFQSHDPHKDGNDGAGLGLTIVRDIIEKHGGKVYISSMGEKGTTVSFTLPLNL